MSVDGQSADLDRLRLERDFYRRVLDLGSETEFGPFLKEALALVVCVTGARQGYIEVHGASDDPDTGWSLAHGFSGSELDEVRSRISRGILGEALSTGKVVETSSALLDPRFLDRKSVQSLKIDAVLCAPIGDDPPLGALYLQGRTAPGSFCEDDCERAKLLARHLAPLAENLLRRHHARSSEDPTAHYRSQLRAENVIGRSEALATMLREVALVAPLDVSVLLTGETGTGKSQVARVIHASGPRAAEPMVELNCAALPEALVESELFGARAGGHSTAASDVSGKVAAAEGGTLLLDEIGDLPLAAQSKLLQLLQTREYYPLGASRPVTADVRLIAATNSDLGAAVRDLRFREDLFYRLAVLPIRVPSLAERATDVPELAAFLCERACVRHGLARVELSRSALRAVESAQWPGNVRQLEHTVEAGAIRAAGSGASQIEPQHLFPDKETGGGADDEVASLQDATRRFQAELLRTTLEQTGWNVSEAARRLDVARSYVYKLISAFGLERARSRD